MPRFCTSCGSPLGESQGFCTNCGAAAPATPSTQASPPVPGPIPAPPAPGAAAVAAAPAKKGSSALKIVLIVVGVVGFFMVLAIGSCFYIAYRMKKGVEQTFKVDNAGKSVTIKTPQGAMTFGETKPHEAAKFVTTDVPAYPDSTPTENGSQISVPGKGGMATQEYETSDPVEKVVAFYKDKLGSKLEVQETEENAIMSLTTPTATTTITISKDEKSGKTKIVILRVTK